MLTDHLFTISKYIAALSFTFSNLYLFFKTDSNDFVLILGILMGVISVLFIRFSKWKVSSAPKIFLKLIAFITAIGFTSITYLPIKHSEVAIKIPFLTVLTLAISFSFLIISILFYSLGKNKTRNVFSRREKQGMAIVFVVMSLSYITALTYYLPIFQQ